MADVKIDTPDPIALIAGHTLAPESYRCPNCRSVDAYPGRLPTDGISCRHCATGITAVDVVAYATTKGRLVALLVDLALVWVCSIWLIGGFVGLWLWNAPTDQNGSLTHAAEFWLRVALICAIATSLASYLALGNVIGSTPGKRAVGLKIVRRDTGNRPGVRLGLVRTLAQLVTILTLGLGYWLLLIGHERRTLHDRIAGTAVIER